MKTLQPLVLSLLLISSHSLTASLLTYEGFDYPQGQLLHTNDGGTGWDAPWMLWNDPVGSPHVINSGGQSLNASPGTNSFANYPLTPSGSYVDTGDGGNGYIFRYLDSSSQIDFGQNNTRYLSWLVRSNNWSGFTLQTTSGAGGPRLWIGKAQAGSSFFKIENETGWASSNGSNITAVGSALDNVTYMLVLKIETSALGNDSLSLKAYSGSQTVPTTDAGLTWDTVNTFNSNQVAAAFGMRTFSTVGGANTIFYDEFVQGTSWADVASPVPEPAIPTLLLGTIIGTLILRRRSRSTSL